jgi:putative ABC transport system permease protein
MGWTRFFRRSRRDDDVRRELHSYIQIETDENIARGMAPEAARAAAIRKLGNPERVREDVYLMNTIAPFDMLWQDLRYAARVLRRDKTFALAAITSLALGIGANTAIFQLLDAIRLRTLPVDRPHELVEVRIPPGKGRTGSFNGRRPMLTYLIWEQIRKRQQVLSGAFAWSSARFNTQPGGEARYVEGLWVSGDFFNVLGVRPIVGRVFSASDDRRGCADPGAVISHAYWQSAFGGRADVLKQSVRVDGAEFSVIGVTSPGFFGIDVGRMYDIAIPLCADALLLGQNTRLDRKNAWWLSVAGRLKPDVTPEAARAQLDAISAAIFEATLPDVYVADERKNYLSFRLTALPAASGVSSIRGDFGSPLVLLLTISALVLVIACANLANLLLARATVREREIAVRLAIGAGRRRLLGQLLVESALVAILGAALGVLVAHVLTRVLVAAISTSYVSVFVDLTWNWRMVAFTAGVAGIACLLFGVIPALRATALAPTAALRSGGRGSTASRQRIGLRRALVVTQVALSLVLMMGALLFVRTLHNLTTLDVGFHGKDVVSAELLHPTLAGTGEQASAVRRVIRERLAALPDLRAAAEVAYPPFGPGGWNENIWVGGSGAKVLSNFNKVSSSYFGALGIAFVSGRGFDDRDTLGSSRVAVVNETFVRRFIQDGNALGRTVRVEVGPGQPERKYEIVGVVKDTRYSDLRNEIDPLVHVPSSQDEEPGRAVTFILTPRTTVDRIIPSVTRAVQEVNPAINLEFTVLERALQISLLRERLMAMLSAAFGFLAGLIAAIGLYGLMSYTVARRSNEIGIRLALGAARGRVLRMVLADAGLHVAIGLTLGVALAVAAGRWVRSLLYGLEPSDPATLAGATGLLAIIGLLATLAPALRAARVDPVTALREE